MFSNNATGLLHDVKKTKKSLNGLSDHKKVFYFFYLKKKMNNIISDCSQQTAYRNCQNPGPQ